MKHILILIIMMPLVSSAQLWGYKGMNDSTVKTQVHVMRRERGTIDRIYSDVEESGRFMRKTECWGEDIDLYFKPNDSIFLETNTKILLDNLVDPQVLEDRFLAKKQVYAVMQDNDLDMVGVIFGNKKDCLDYIGDRKSKWREVTLYYRNRKSYEELYRRRAKMYKNSSWFKKGRWDKLPADKP